MNPLLDLLVLGEGPIRVANGQRAMLPGEIVTVEGVTVEVVSADENGDVVRMWR